MKIDIFIAAKEGPNNITVYYTSDHRLMLKSGGTWTWRNNNPGNRLQRAQRSKCDTESRIKN